MRRAGPSALALPVSVMMAMVWIVVACGLSGGPTSALPTGSMPVTARPIASEPAPSVPPSAPPTAPPPTARPPTARPPTAGVPGIPASPNPVAPPPGWLAAGGEPVEGLLGAYCWTANGVGVCVDSVAFTYREPDLPTLTAGQVGGQLQFTLADQYQFASWSASYIDENGNSVPLGSAGASFDPDAIHPSTGPVMEATFDAPPSGSQSIVQLFVRFAGGGDASYGWKVTLP